LNDDARRELFELATEQRYGKGASVFTSDDPADSVFVLLRGRVKVYDLAEQGKELILWFFHSGDLFGIAEMSERHRGASARACENSEILSIPRERFRDFVTHRPDVAWRVIELLGRRLRTLGDVVQNLATTCVTGRVVKLLQRLDTVRAKDLGGLAPPELQLTHQDIADMIGCCRQSVTETLGMLKRSGAIECERQRVRVVDAAALRAALTPQQ
jgi:CRP-like cAMP-binding protein